MSGWTLNLLFAITLIASGGDLSAGQGPVPTDWLVGEKFVKVSTTPNFSIAWIGAELRSDLQIASRNAGIAVLIDRRLDPDQKITLELRNVSFEQFLWNIADQADAGVVRLDNLYYLGPPDTVATIQQRLQTFELETNRLNRDSKLRKGLLTRQWFRSDSTIEPRTLIVNLCLENGIPAEGLTAIPHDFWSEINLPRLEVREIVSLVAAGFDLDLAVSDENGLTVVPALHPESVEYRIPKDVSARTPLSQIRSMDSVTRAKRTGTDIITGTAGAVFAVMREIALHQANDKAAVDPDSREVVSLHVKATRGNIAATAARLLSVQLVFSGQDRKALDEFIEVNVDKVSAEELLEACLRGSGLKYRITESELQIYKGES